MPDTTDTQIALCTAVAALAAYSGPLNNTQIALRNAVLQLATQIQALQTQIAAQQGQAQ